MSINKFFLFCLLFPFLHLFSQETETDLFKSDKKNERYNAGLPVLSPVILPAYTPEMGFILSGGGLVSFKTKRNNDYLRHSILSLLLNSDLKNGIESNLNLNSYWFDERVVFNLTTFLINRDNHYWGVGFENAEKIEKGDNTTLYHNKSYKITPTLMLKIVDHFYAGVIADFSKVQADKLSDLMLEDKDILKFGNNMQNSGIGLTLYYDSRNMSTYPTKGLYININGIFFDDFLAGDYSYKIASIDFRQYLPLFRKGSVIAWQFNSKIGFGEIPWCEMQQLGTSNDLRGFFNGQYRDKSSSIVQLEYRHTFNKKNQEILSRHGFVFWIGGGTVYPDVNHITKALFNTGIGYRFELQPQNNLRIDLGFGTKTSGIYINFNESF